MSGLLAALAFLGADGAWLSALNYVRARRDARRQARAAERTRIDREAWASLTQCTEGCSRYPYERFACEQACRERWLRG